MKLWTLSLSVLLSTAALAQTPVNDPPTIDPVIERLQALQHIRGRLEQDMGAYMAEARNKSGVRPMQAQQPEDLRLMRQDVQANLQRMEERFRCLDVDISGNNGNVVLVCGNNHGAVSSNTQQAFGADLNVNGGGL